MYVLTSTLFDISMLMTMALTVPVLAYLIIKRKENTVTWRIALACIAAAYFAFFMLSQPSKIIWDSLPLLQKIQFPWRWLSVVSLLAVTAFALTITRVLEIFRSHERLVAYPALALVFAIVLFDITQIVIPSDPIPNAKFSKVEERLAEEPMFEGWWPIWAKHEGFLENARPAAAGREIELWTTEGDVKIARVAAGSGAELLLPVFYYPHWKASVNGQLVTVQSNDNGVVKVPITSDPVTVKLYFEEPLKSSITRWISLTTWFAFAFLFVLRFSRTAFRRTVTRPLLEQQFDTA